MLFSQKITNSKKSKSKAPSPLLGAALLDLDNPTKVIGHMDAPLLAPNDEEREGYVPNVVYSCGSMVHNGELIIPYAMSDSASTFATVSLKDLIDELLKR